MKSKTLIVATFLAASLVVGSTAQAHDDGYPIGLLSGVILGLSLDHDDHYYYRDRHYNRHYHHREYRRHDSHGYQYRDRYKRNHRYDKHKRKHHRNGRWD